MKEKINVIGAGFACIDMIEYNTDRVILPGGTAANVMTFLSQLGMDVSFLCARYGDEGGKWLEKSLKNRGIQLCHFTNSKMGVPRIIEVIGENGEHKFSTTCPVCQKKLPSCILPNEGQIQMEILQLVSNANIFYYDRMSTGIKKIVSQNLKGWNMYEPNSCRFYNTFFNASKESDILKFSQDRIAEKYAQKLYEELQVSKVQLIIVTMGEQGIKFSVRESEEKLSEWIFVDACKCDKVIDNSGAGDWLTSVFLFNFLKKYPFFTKFLNKDEIKDFLIKAREVASYQCGFVGAQGVLQSYGAVKKISKILETNMMLVENEPLWEEITCECCLK